ncbi:MAG TPA: hypothetical protein VGL13_04010 [Polyangiaceae bacterium]
MPAYIVAELIDNGWSLDHVEGLTAAKYYAAERVKEVGRPVVVRDYETGLEVARFAPGQTTKTTSERPPSARPGPSSHALLRLRAANQRLQAIVESQSKAKKDPSSHS